MSLATETMAVYNNLQQPPPPPLSVINNNNNKYSNNNNENNNGPVPSVGGVGINGQIIGDPNNGGVENGMVRGWGQYLWRQYVAGAQGNSRNYNNNGGAEEDLWSGGDESPQHGAPPGFWDRSYETDLKYVDLDEFLSENGVSMDGLNSSLTPATHNSHLNSTTNGHNNNNNVHSTHTSTNNSSTHSPTSNSPTVGGLGSIVTNGGPGMGPLGAGLGSLGVGLGAVGNGLGSVGGLVGVSNGLVRTKRERRSPSPSDCCPDSPEEADSSSLSIASSGNSRHHSFDPRTRAFSDEELRPQPMVKKSRKQYVPDDLKDDKYWARRRKNNMAAKRSRDARRIKENQIALRAGYLEKENIGLRQELDRLRKENHLLRDKLSKYADV